MLDSEAAMTRFLNLVATEPEIARVPIMIDSSKWSRDRGGPQVRAGQVHRQLDQPEGGRGRVPGQGPHGHALRSRRRRDGVRRARPGREQRTKVRDLPARLPASHRAGRVSIRTTSSSIPTSSRWPPGIEGHNRFGINFIEATRLIKEHLPGAKVSGGISNLSFSFRGNDRVREAFHSAFLYHAIKAGLDMGIVNAGQLVVYEDIPKDLLEHVEDVLFDRRPDATERMVEFAEQVKGAGKKREQSICAGASSPSTSASSTRSCTASSTSSTTTSRRRARSSVARSTSSRGR